MHKFLLAALATTLAIATLSLPTEARVDTFRDNGWHVMIPRTNTAPRVRSN